KLFGYSSLRFRPIRHLSSPVEDLEMCKVVGVSDKVLIVQSMVNKETFVVKSLVKSSWESRDQTTIIPQGVPYMVKLLRYYVSEDAVYLHLEHIKGKVATSGRLDQQTLISGLTRTQVNTHIHPPAPSLCLHSNEAQEKPALPLSCARVSQALDVMSELHKKKAGMGLIECSTDFEAAWKAADPAHSYNNTNLYAVTGNNLQRHEEDQIIEVDGWCHLPRFPAKTSRPAEKALQSYWGLPEGEVRVWGAQILLALESLHEQGILCRDLNPRNILLTGNGKVCLTFFSQWSEVQSEISSKAMEQMYCAPEIGGVSRITEACDWWSLGALLFELLTGMPLWQLHPAGIHSHTQLLIPNHLSAAAASLLTELLQFDAGYRLGSGGGGVSDIKCHPFFSGVSWKALSC
uniref:Ribosomal protein S6 kinase-like 1 n=1 Tax=Xiphophorus couchianus TaxID=32473 RepID=A0A3B5LY86_9TELE